MKKHKKESTKVPMTIAFTLIGMVMAKMRMVSGALEKSSFINKSERPTALRIFMFRADSGVNILARQSHCISTTQGSHFSVRRIRTNG